MIGVSVAGFQTTAFPATMAGNDFHVAMAMGKFQGVIIPTTPIGARTLIANLFCNSAGVVCPNRRLPSPPYKKPYRSLLGLLLELLQELFHFLRSTDEIDVLFAPS